MSHRQNRKPVKRTYLNKSSPGSIAHQSGRSKGYRDLNASIIAFVTSPGKQTGEYPPGLL